MGSSTELKRIRGTGNIIKWKECWDETKDGRLVKRKKVHGAKNISISDARALIGSEIAKILPESKQKGLLQNIRPRCEEQ